MFATRGVQQETLHVTATGLLTEPLATLWHLAHTCLCCGCGRVAPLKEVGSQRHFDVLPALQAAAEFSRKPGRQAYSVAPVHPHFTLNISHRGVEWGVEGQSGPELNGKWSPHLVLFNLSVSFQVLWPLLEEIHQS